MKPWSMCLNNGIYQGIYNGMKQRGSVGCKLALLALTSGWLGGCVGDILQSKVVEPQIYVLQATTTTRASVAYPAQINIGLPSAAPGLDSSHIAVLRNHNQLDYFYGARWGSAAPRVVQAFLISLMQAQQGFKGIVADNARVDADYLLELELRDFQAEYPSEKANPSVRVTLNGTLIDIKTRTPVATLNSTATVAANDNRLSEVVTAFQTATLQAGSALSEQLTMSLATVAK